MAQKYDVVIIGGGPNGLTAGAYLSKAGLKVVVLDKKCEMGGGAATEDLTLPGVRHNTHAIYMQMVDYAPAYQDLELETKYNLKHIYPSLQFAMPLLDGRSLCIYSDVEKTCQSFAKFSQKDAEAYRDIYNRATKYTEAFLAPATYHPSMPPLEQVAKLEKSEIGKEISEFSEKTPLEIVNDLFENEQVRCLMLYIVCMWGLDPEVSGVGYLPLLYFNRSTNYRLCAGGTHALPQSLIKVILDNGGSLVGSVRIKRIILKDGVASGVEMDDGTVIEAEKAVLSTIDPHQTFFDLVGKENLEEELSEKIEMWRWEWESLLTVHLALTEPPAFTVAADNPELNKALVYVLGYETQERLLEEFAAIKRGELMEEVAFNCCFPSVHDPLQLAKPVPNIAGSVEKHTGYLSSFAPYELKEGGADKWYSMSFKEEQIRRHIETLRKYAPNLTDDKILGTFTNTPLDIENKFSDMVKGGIKQGEYHPLQMGYLRPNELCSQNRTPIKNLYVGGASVFPGGLILLGSGYLAANSIVEDLGVEKWWQEPESVTKAKEMGLL